MRTQKNPIKLTNVDNNDNGFFKANRNNDFADTIEDNPNMYVDMPVDFKKTEQIIDVN